MSSISIGAEQLHEDRCHKAKFKPGFRSGVIAFCFLTIGVVSALDIWFAVVNTNIRAFEKNPVCMALIELDPQRFTFFILGKSLGTAAVMAVILSLFRNSYRHAQAVMFAITLFQIGLLTFLVLSDPLTNHLPNFELLFTDTHESIWVLE